MTGAVYFILTIFALQVFSIPAQFRGIPSGDELADPAILERWEQFRLNITSKEKSGLMSCLEDQTYSAINDFANCHLFCPLCNQGYGRCESTDSIRMCICDCSSFNLFLNFDCPWTHKLCTSAAQSADQAQKLITCQNECRARGFEDAALCGADMEDPPLLRSTCTCLCP